MPMFGVVDSTRVLEDSKVHSPAQGQSIGVRGLLTSSHEDDGGLFAGVSNLGISITEGSPKCTVYNGNHGSFGGTPQFSRPPFIRLFVRDS